MNHLLTDLPAPSEELVEVLLYLDLSRPLPLRNKRNGQLRFEDLEITFPVHVKVPKNYVDKHNYMESYLQEKLYESGNDIASVRLESMYSSSRNQWVPETPDP